jgi:hypothetical protein
MRTISGAFSPNALNVRYWHKADFAAGVAHVRFRSHFRLQGESFQVHAALAFGRFQIEKSKKYGFMGGELLLHAQHVIG